MTRPTLLTLFLVLFCISFSAAQTINATHADGISTIHLESPSQLSEIYWVNSTGSGLESYYYVFGETTFKSITFGYPFQAQDVSRRYGLPFISVALFHNGTTGIVYAVGPTFRDLSGVPTTGYFLPLGFSSPYESMSFQGTNNTGYTFYSVAVDSRNQADVLVYFVGWGPEPGTPGGIRLVLVRSHLNMDGPFTSRGFFWNNTDVVTLYNNDYNTFSSTFRPHIYQEWWQNRMYVLDPSSHALYQIFVPNTTTDPIYLMGTPLYLPTNGRIAGVAYTPYFNMLYVGLANNGINPGNLISISLPNMRIYNQTYFPQYYSNPIAMTEFNQTLYIGFAEGPQFIELSTQTFNITGYQRAPDYLRNSYRAFDAGHEHVYFITREQHSKVFRIHKNDFCATACPFDGYCENRRCVCRHGYAFNSQNFCVIPPSTTNTVKETIQVDKGTGIAFGILWALTLIAAGAGWFLWYRSGHSYTQV